MTASDLQAIRADEAARRGSGAAWPVSASYVAEGLADEVAELQERLAAAEAENAELRATVFTYRVLAASAMQAVATTVANRKLNARIHDLMTAKPTVWAEGGRRMP